MIPAHVVVVKSINIAAVNSTDLENQPLIFNKPQNHKPHPYFKNGD